jgi:sugar (glycoside-pentoside-hexuronide) transporter
VSRAPDTSLDAAPREDARLTAARKACYASGDFTLNTALSALTIVYVSYFLTQIAGLRPELAGLVQLVGRCVDAFTDPAMGRISDACRWPSGRRRPFLLIGALPFGAAFALLWVDLVGASQAQMFAYYTSMYVLLSLAMTVLSVPYLALQPEMALGYDARTSLNTYRNAGSVLGFFAIVGIRPLANAAGGGGPGFAVAGGTFGLLLGLPWLLVHRASWERPEYQQQTPRMTLLQGVLAVARNLAFRRLVLMYVFGRIAMDLVGAMLLLYFTHYLGRSGEFEPMMLLFFCVVLVALPWWLRLARYHEKAGIFVAGALWWMVSLLLLAFARPEWPPLAIFSLGGVGAVGYAVMDLMPWSMLGEVVDEDDLATGERREGIYNGFFTFLRKLSGSLAVALAFVLLGALGFVKGDVQSPDVRNAIRLFATLGPALCLGVAVWFARAYPLTRERHAEILAALAARDARP